MSITGFAVSRPEVPGRAARRLPAGTPQEQPPDLTGTCSASGTTDAWECSAPSAVLMTTGCVHEHLGTDELCETCAGNFIGASAQGLMRCIFCGAYREIITVTPVLTEGLAG